MTETRKMPPLGGGSVDFNAVHAADAKGKDLVEAIEAATTYVRKPAPLTGEETLADLRDIAARNSVPFEPGALKADLVAAIEAFGEPTPRRGIDVEASDVAAAPNDPPASPSADAAPSA